MPTVESLKEAVPGQLTAELMTQRQREGWRLSAVVWERDVEAAQSARTEPVPFGLSIAPDGSALLEKPEEREVMLAMLEMIVADQPISYIAAELNRRGFHTRRNSEWTPGAVFDLLPRLIDVSPKVFNSEDWVARRRKVLPPRTGQNV